MKELVNISGQQFYYSTINQVIGRWSQKEKCAIIIDESYLDEFLTESGNLIRELNQIIIISKHVNTAIKSLQGVNVLLIAVDNFNEGVKIALLGNNLSNKVICVPKEDENVARKIMDEIVT